MFEMYDVIFEIYIQGELARRQRMQAPKEILITYFFQLAQQIKDDPRPIQMKMIRPVFFWDQFEQKERTLNNEIILSNLVLTAMEKE